MARGIKVVSGGQSGVDRAALDVALALGIPVGGWCPRDRWAEDGPIPERYPLTETRSQDVTVRTQRNVECSTCTLVLTRGSPMGGVRLTVDYAEAMCRPYLVVDLLRDEQDHERQIAAWLERTQPTILNVAGPRESNAPGISEQAFELLYRTFRRSPWIQSDAPRPRERTSFTGPALLAT